MQKNTYLIRAKTQVRQLNCLKAIKQYMINKELRQWEMANFLECPAGTLNRWLNDRSPIQRLWLTMIEKKLGIKTEKE